LISILPMFSEFDWPLRLVSETIKIRDMWYWGIWWTKEAYGLFFYTRIPIAIGTN